jgi:hypothetical protein
MCFVVSGKSQIVLDRPRGSYCQYPASLLRATTAQTGGIQKSMLLVDETTDVEIDGDCVTVINAHIEAFLRLAEGISASSAEGTANERTRVQMCTVCQDALSTHVPIPCGSMTSCGHLCICGICSTNVMNQSKQCPLCRADVSGFMKVFV